jgi:hypothetical protein
MPLAGNCSVRRLLAGLLTLAVLLFSGVGSGLPALSSARRWLMRGLRLPSPTWRTGRHRDGDRAGVLRCPA